MTTSKYPLCVAAPSLGKLSETFIRRHVLDLMPGATTMIAMNRARGEASAWTFEGPTFVVRERRSPIVKAINKLDSKLRLSQARKHNESITYSARESREMVGFLKEMGAQAILVNFLDSFLPFVEDIRAAGIRWYSFGHGYDVSLRLTDPWWKQRYTTQLAEADGIFVRAEVIRSRLIDTGLSSERIHVVRGGVDVPDSLPPEPVRRSPLQLLAVGRMVPKKSPLKLLQALDVAIAAGADVHLQYVGGGPLLPAARQFIRDHELSSSVTLHGPQLPSFVAELLRSSDIFVQHSVRDPLTGDEEGLPASITEAMALAIPVVSTRHAGIPEAVEEGVSGFLVEENDSEAMGMRIAELARNPDLRRKMGARGWEIAKARFRWPDERTRLLDLMGLSESIPP